MYKGKYGISVNASLLCCSNIVVNQIVLEENWSVFTWKNNENKRMVFTSKDYNELLKLIPGKEMSYIQNSKIVESNTSQENNIYKHTEELAKLRDKDILTEDEFNNKKQLLLDKIQ